jgi:hypothetical protein
MLLSMPIHVIHGSKNPNRLHYLADWIERRHLKQADVVRALGVDKATVSRWCSGQMPEQKKPRSAYWVSCLRRPE